MGCGGVCYSPEKDYSNTGHQPDTAAEESPLFFCVCISGNSVHMDELLLYVCGHTGLGRVTSVSVRRHRQVLWKQVTAVFFTQYKRQMCVCVRVPICMGLWVCVCLCVLGMHVGLCKCVQVCFPCPDRHAGQSLTNLEDNIHPGSKKIRFTETDFLRADCRDETHGRK